MCEPLRHSTVCEQWRNAQRAKRRLSALDAGSLLAYHWLRQRTRAGQVRSGHWGSMTLAALALLAQLDSRNLSLRRLSIFLRRLLWLAVRLRSLERRALLSPTQSSLLACVSVMVAAMAVSAWKPRSVQHAVGYRAPAVRVERPAVAIMV